MPAEDWNVMFAAVISRLESAVAKPLSDLPNGAGPALRAEVMDCIEALTDLRLRLLPLLTDTTPVATQGGQGPVDKPGRGVHP